MTKLVLALESRIYDEIGQAGDSLETSPYQIQARAQEQVGRDSETEDQRTGPWWDRGRRQNGAEGAQTE